MRTGNIRINQIDYPVTFSIGTQIAMEEQHIEIKDALKGVSSTMHLLYEMMRSGHKWAIKNGQSAPEVPDFDDMIESIDTDDLVEIMTELVAVMTGERNVQAKPAKK